MIFAVFFRFFADITAHAAKEAHFFVCGKPHMPADANERIRRRFSFFDLAEFVLCAPGHMKKNKKFADDAPALCNKTYAKKHEKTAAVSGFRQKKAAL